MMVLWVLVDLMYVIFTNVMAQAMPVSAYHSVLGDS
jgi:hypothetical protein